MNPAAAAAVAAARHQVCVSTAVDPWTGPICKSCPVITHYSFLACHYESNVPVFWRLQINHGHFTTFLSRDPSQVHSNWPLGNQLTESKRSSAFCKRNTIGKHTNQLVHIIKTILHLHIKMLHWKTIREAMNMNYHSLHQWKLPPKRFSKSCQPPTVSPKTSTSKHWRLWLVPRASKFWNAFCNLPVSLFVFLTCGRLEVKTSWLAITHPPTRFYAIVVT